MPAFSSRSRCMYSSGREIPSRRASSLTWTRPSASSAMTRSRSGLATAVSTVSSSSSSVSGPVSWVSVGSWLVLVPSHVSSVLHVSSNLHMTAWLVKGLSRAARVVVRPARGPAMMGPWEN